MRKVFVLAATAAAVLVTGLATTPAQAQSVTFALTGSTLSIAEPGTATLTGGALTTFANSTITGELGSTVVTDNRGGILGWTSQIAGTTAFTDGTTSIAVTNAKVWIPASPGISATGVVTATQGTYLAQLSGLALTSSGQALVTATVVVGNNTATFNPQIAVAIPSNATAGTYTGAVTQTVL